jgi:hypothetical protein
MTKAEKSGIALEVLAGVCTTGSCPTVYRTDRNSLIVQGYVVTAADAGVDLPEGESLVEIPLDLLLDAARRAG